MFKKLVKIVLILILLAVVAGAAVYVFVDEIIDKYKPEIKKYVTAATNCSFDYQDASLILLPIAQISFTNVSLSECSSGELKGVKLQLPAASAFVNLYPLYHKHLHILSLTLSDLDFQIDRTLARSDDSAAPEASSTQNSPHAITIHRLSIKNASLDVKDLGNELNLNKFNLLTSIEFNEDKFEVGTISADTEFRQRSGTGKVIAIPRIEFNSELGFEKDTISTENMSILLKTSEALDQEIKLESAKLEFNKADSSFKIINSSLKGYGGTAAFNLAGNLVQKRVKGSLNVERLALASVNSLLKVFSQNEFKLVSGNPNVKAELEFELDSTTQSVKAKKIHIKDFQNAGKNIKIADLQFASLIFKREGAGKFLLSTDTSISNLLIDGSNKDGYRATESKGNFKIELQKSGTYDIAARQKVQGFQYFDQAVQISEVDADISSIKGSIAKNSDAAFNIGLSGQKIKLASANFWVNNAESISSELKILVPAKGGYSVEGPVSAQKASMKFEDKPLENVSGSVNIFISGPLKRFNTSDLSFVNNSEAITGAAVFDMNKDTFILSKLNANGFGGQATGGFSMKRDGSKQINANVSLGGMIAERLLPVLGINKSGSFKGRIKSFDTTAKFVKTDFPNSLDGRGSLALEEGSIEQLTIDSQMAKIMGSLPVIGSQFAIEPVSYTEKNSRKNGFLFRPNKSRSLSLSFKVANKLLQTNDLSIAGRYGTTKASGSLDFEKGFDLKGSVVVLEETFKALGGPVGPLSRLFGSLGRIEVPFYVTGSAENPIVNADVSRIMALSGPTRWAGDALRGAGDVLDLGWGAIAGRRENKTEKENLDTSN